MFSALVDALKRRLPALLLYVGTASTLIIGIVAQAVGFIVLARYLGKEQFGHLATVTAVTIVGAQVCGLGSGEAMLRRVSRDRSVYSSLLGHNLILLCASGVVLTATLTAGMALFVRIVVDPLENLWVLLLLVVSNVVLYSWVSLTEQVFLAHGRYVRANIVNSGYGVARASTVAIACFGFGADTLPTWALWGAACNAVVSLVCLAAIWRYGRPRWIVLSDELPLGISITISSFFFRLRQNIDILAMAIFLSPSIVGAYGVAKRIVVSAYVIGGAFDRLIYNKLAIAGKYGPSGALRLARKYVVYAVGLGGAASIALFVAAPILPLVFGRDFVETIVILRILCWTLVPFAVLSVAFDAVIAADRHQIRTIVGAAATIVGASLVVGLTYLFGITGTFFGVYASDILMAVVMWLTLMWLANSQGR